MSWNNRYLIIGSLNKLCWLIEALRFVGGIYQIKSKQRPEQICLFRKGSFLHSEIVVSNAFSEFESSEDTLPRGRCFMEENFSTIFFPPNNSRLVNVPFEDLYLVKGGCRKYLKYYLEVLSHQYVYDWYIHILLFCCTSSCFLPPGKPTAPSACSGLALCVPTWVYLLLA